MAHRLVRGLRGAVKNLVVYHQPKPINHFLKSSTRNYLSEYMHKSAVEGNIARFIRNEIQYELDHSPPIELVFGFYSFKVDERPGEQWIRLKGKFGENEEIKIEVTMFDASIPMKKTDELEDVKLRVTMIIDVTMGKDNILEFVCSGWPDSIEIRNVFTCGRDGIKNKSYVGPKFKELDDELQDSLYDFLEARGIDDKLAEFLHAYMMIKDKNEYLRWMDNLKTFVLKK
ncbi:hypothetical protein ACS0TY_017845 [Phlomoides rotata]